MAVRVAATSAMDKVIFRLVFLHDLTYAVQIMMPDGSEKVVKGFANEAAAEVWLAEVQRVAPKGEVWTRRRNVSWRQ